MLRPTLLAVSLIGALSSAVAQTHLISTPAITACGDSIFPSNGPGAFYDNGESFTSVVCPDQPGGRVSLSFAAFDLDTDSFSIHDGSSTTAPLIGTYVYNDLLYDVVVASAQNTSGCLTLVFTSDAAGVGYFAIGLQCWLPCDSLVPSFTTNQGDTAYLCQGDTLFVDGSSSQASGGQSITEHFWFVDGVIADTSAGPTSNFVFDVPGIHMIQLAVGNGTGCVGLPGDPQFVLVSGAPIFSGTVVQSPVCVPGSSLLQGDAWMPDLQFAFGGGTTTLGGYIPDDVGIPFVSSVLVEADATETISTASDLNDICLSIEHSFMGDLVIELECPNGQSVVLHQQGGAGTYLGMPIDQTGAPEPGTCWSYCFNADPDNGTWVDCSYAGPTPNVINTGTGLSLAPGSYAPVESLDALVGCPVAGNWTLTIVDLWGADDGYLCSWILDQPFAQDSTLSLLGPTLALDDPGSASWSSTDASIMVTSPVTATADIAATGEFDMVFTVVNSYGCVYDTTLTVIGVEAAVVDAGPDGSLCDGPVELNGSVTNIPAADSCVYMLVFQDSFGDGWNGGATLTWTIDGIATSYTMPPGLADTVLLDLTDDASIVLFYQAGVIWNIENSFSFYGPTGDLIYASPQGPPTSTLYTGIADCSTVASVITIAWSPNTGLTDPDLPQTLAFPPASGWYVLSASYPGGTCAASDSVWVEGNNGTTVLQWNSTALSLCADATGLASYSWYYAGELSSITSTPCLINPTYGYWFVVGYPATGCAVYSDTMLICPDLQITFINDTLYTTPYLGVYVWTFNGEEVLGESGNTLPYMGSGAYTVTVIMSNGCGVGSGSGLIQTGVADGSGPAHLSFVPNPALEEVRVDLGAYLGSVQLIIIDATGRIVHGSQAVGGGPRTLYVDALEAGVYTVIARHGSGPDRSARLVVR